jgi:TPR repeat protein
MFRPTLSHTLMAQADRGDADGQFELGRIYFEGRADASSNTVSKDGKHGIASFMPGLPRNHAAAAALLQKAADQGHTAARRLLEYVKLHTAKDVH